MKPLVRFVPFVRISNMKKIQYVSLPEGYRVCLENPRDDDPKVAGVIVKFHKFDGYVDVMWEDTNLLAPDWYPR